MFVGVFTSYILIFGRYACFLNKYRGKVVNYL